LVTGTGAFRRVGSPNGFGVCSGEPDIQPGSAAGVRGTQPIRHAQWREFGQPAYLRDVQPLSVSASYLIRLSANVLTSAFGFRNAFSLSGGRSGAAARTIVSKERRTGLPKTPVLA